MGLQASSGPDRWLLKVPADPCCYLLAVEGGPRPLAAGWYLWTPASGRWLGIYRAAKTKYKDQEF
jgi:hypothetical protein